MNKRKKRRLSQQSEGQRSLETVKQTLQQFLLRDSSKNVQSGADQWQRPLVGQYSSGSHVPASAVLR